MNDWNQMARYLPLVILIVLAVAFFSLGLDYHLSLVALGKSYSTIDQYVNLHWPFSWLIFILVYTLIVACSIPVATLLTLLAGSLFGLWWGAVASIIAASFGACLIVIAIERALFKPTQSALNLPGARSLSAKFSNHVIAYTLILRLVPIFPFWAVNIMAGILKVPLGQFVIASALGMIPGVLIYVKIGQNLAQILKNPAQFNPGVLFEPQFLLPLLVLSVLIILPIVIKALWFRSKK